jgi:RHS repeat-associated protein
VARLVERRTSFSGNDPAANPDRTQTFDYDGNGNMTDMSDTDLKTPGGMSVRVRTSYSNDREAHATAYPLITEVSDSSHRRLRYAAYTYDEPACAARPKEHSLLLTSVERWIDDHTSSRKHFGYGSSGNLVCIVDEFGGGASIDFDADAEYAVSTKNVLGQIRTFSYYGVNGDTAVTGLPGYLHTVTVASNGGPNAAELRDVTEYRYGPTGRLERIINPDDSSLQVDYHNIGDPASQNVSLELSAGLSLQEYLDGFGHAYRTVQSATSRDSVATMSSYDSTGRVVGISEPQLLQAAAAAPAQTSRWRARLGYDALGRLLFRTDSTGSMRQQCYDGLQVVAIDPNGHARRETLDVFGRPVLVEEFDGEVSACDGVAQRPVYAATSYTYDGLGQLQRVTKGGFVVSEFSYDGLGNVTRIHNVDRGDVVLGYDLAGRLSRVQQQDQQILEYTRDPIGRVKTVTARKGSGRAKELWRYSYDSGPHAQGRLTGSAAPGYQAVYGYDARGNNVVQTIHTEGQPVTLRLKYDAAGRIQTITYPDGRVLTYKYDGAVLASIGEDATPVQASKSYLTASNFNEYLEPAQLQFGNGVIETLDYGMGRDQATQDPCSAIPSGGLCRLSLSVSGSLARSLLYHYDKAGNVAATDDSADGHKIFTYDRLDRLTGELVQPIAPAAGGPVASATYSYDTIGRRTATSFQGPYQYQRDTSAARPSLPSSVGAVGVQPDSTGHIISIGGTRYAFDALGQLTRVTLPDHSSVAYSYDWMGSLVKRKSSRGSQPTLPGGASTLTFPSPYLTCAGNSCEDLVYGYGGIAAKLTRGDAEYYHLDRTGTRFAVTTSGGRLKTALSYSSFGVLTGTATQDAVYAGHRWDPDARLYWFGSRFYDPALGQFLSPDSDSRLTAGVTNPYGYAFSNPLRWIDPDGHQEFPVETTSRGGGISINWPAVNCPSCGGINLFPNSGGGFGGPNWGGGPGPHLGTPPTGGTSIPGAQTSAGPPSIASTAVYAESDPFTAALGGLVASAATEGAALLSSLADMLAADTAAIGTAAETGTVWDAITATGAVHEGTVVPQSFTLATEGADVWVAPNASKHLAEYALGNIGRGVSTELVNIGSQAQLTSLQAAVAAATTNGVAYDTLLNEAGWELIFQPARQAGDLPALIHALPPF